MARSGLIESSSVERLSSAWGLSTSELAVWKARIWNGALSTRCAKRTNLVGFSHAPTSTLSSCLATP